MGVWAGVCVCVCVGGGGGVLVMVNLYLPLWPLNSSSGQPEKWALFLFLSCFFPVPAQWPLNSSNVLLGLRKRLD